jgi:hypothetical protein
MSKTITKECMALLKEVSEMFEETGCVPGAGGEEAPAEDGARREVLAWRRCRASLPSMICAGLRGWQLVRRRCAEGHIHEDYRKAQQGD